MVPTGQGRANTYLVDILIPFGDPQQGAPMHLLENMTVMEYQGNNQNYQGLVGRDIIRHGMFSISGWTNPRFTFCL